MKKKTRSRLLIAGSVAWVLAVAGVLFALPNLTKQPSAELPKYTPDAGPVRVVASVAVWADVASQVGGEYAEVQAVLTSTQQDPHSYEASARDQLLVNEATLTVANGGFYDEFFSRLVQASPNKFRNMQANMVDVSAAFGDADSPVAGNDHIWYDFKTMKAAATELAYRINLGLADPAARQAVKNQARDFANRIGDLEKTTAELRNSATGKRAIATEGFSAYLLRNLGITDATPNAFKLAVEEETDASPAVMEELRLALTEGRVDVLIVNEQTESAQTKRLVQWATDADVPVVLMSETLPTGLNYQDWMLRNLIQLANALL